MKDFLEYDRELVARRVRRHRETLREAGLRPVQLWAVDSRRAGFAADCKDQCQIVDERRGARRRTRRRWIRLRRGDLVTLESVRARSGATQASNHALLIQQDQFSALPYVAVLPVTDRRCEAPLLRVAVGQSRFAMVDQLRMIPRRSVRGIHGRIDGKSQRAVDRALALFLGIAS